MGLEASWDGMRRGASGSGCILPLTESIAMSFAVAICRGVVLLLRFGSGAMRLSGTGSSLAEGARWVKGAPR